MNSLQPANDVGGIMQQAENQVELEVTHEMQNRKLAEIEKRTKRPLEVYNNEDEHYAQILSTEALPVYFCNLPIRVLAICSYKML